MSENKAKAIRRKPGRFIIEKPMEQETSLYDEAYTVIYYQHEQYGWLFAFMGDRRRLAENCGSMERVIETYGYTLECASEIVNQYSDPMALRIIDTESGEIVNPLSEEELKGEKQPKIVQKDLFGNDFVWGVDI